MAQRWSFGEGPLPEVVELAGVLRDLTSTVLALEQPSEELRALIGALRASHRRLSAALPHDLSPRVGVDVRDDQRVYVDHSRDVGAYNPCFPRYDLTVSGSEGRGTVEFPICYEGPPGVVHGGFLAVFFDCVLQQLNCDLGVSGKTAELSVRFRRPTPLLTPLTVWATRAIEDDRIRSHGELRLDGRVLCECEMLAVVGDRAALPPASPRRR